MKFIVRVLMERGGKNFIEINYSPKNRMIPSADMNNEVAGESQTVPPNSKVKERGLV